MVSILHIFVIGCISWVICSDVSEISKRSSVLIRKKRYLTFPPGSNFVIQIASVKSLLRAQPLNWNVLEEMDFPFALPSDTKWIKYFNRGKRDRRQIQRQIGRGLTLSGMNGTACVKRIICDIQNYFPLKGKSLLKDILLSVFKIDDGTYSLEDMCVESLYSDCRTSFIDYIFEGGLLDSGD